ncbi:MAG: ornithine cyclodeaminase [Bacteroidales bacterium]|nr:ornithine cyclodeaminase [Bacteroidales bacterium]
MKIIGFSEIQKLNIQPLECYKWVQEALSMKGESLLPAKISLKLPDNVFFNFMPCHLPLIDRVGIKVVSRFPQNTPSLKAQLLLFEASTGKNLALMDATWITAMRTGAVAALSINMLQKKDAKNYSFMGLGNTSRATLLTLLATNPNKIYNIKLLKYKDQVESFIKRFSNYKNISFTVTEDIKDLFSSADVIVSGVSFSDNIFGKDDWFKEGVLVVPIHTRGFQNCDLFFDKVIADDKDHVKDFKYFDRFKCFEELSDILVYINNKGRGRLSQEDRIIAYNIGIALHDIYFASKIFDQIKGHKTEDKLLTENNKFWV